MAQDLLEGFVTKEEVARQLNKSTRTIERMIERRELAYIPRIGIHVESSRELLLKRVIKPVRRGRK